MEWIERFVSFKWIIAHIWIGRWRWGTYTRTPASVPCEPGNAIRRRTIGGDKYGASNAKFTTVSHFAESTRWHLPTIVVWERRGLNESWGRTVVQSNIIRVHVRLRERQRSSRRQLCVWNRTIRRVGWRERRQRTLNSGRGARERRVGRSRGGLVVGPGVDVKAAHRTPLSPRHATHPVGERVQQAAHKAARSEDTANDADETQRKRKPSVVPLAHSDQQWGEVVSAKATFGNLEYIFKVRGIYCESKYFVNILLRNTVNIFLLDKNSWDPVWALIVIDLSRLHGNK